MNEQLIKRVRELRAINPWHPMPFRTAVDIARYELAAETAEPEFLRGITEYPYDDLVTGQVDGFDVEVKIWQDDDAQLGDDDVTGTFTDQESDVTRKVTTGESWDTNGNGYKFYEPSNYDQTELPQDMLSWGLSRGNMRLAYEACLRRAEYEDRHRDYYGITVTVSLDGTEVGSAVIGGIDTIPDYRVRPYMIEVARDHIIEALYEAKDNLEKAAAKAEQHAATLRAGANSVGQPHQHEEWMLGVKQDGGRYCRVCSEDVAE